MLFTDPYPTRFDLNFSLFGIPVRVHPMFWIIALMFAGSEKPPQAAMFVLVVFVSILVHELGHAVVTRFFGWPPAIVLYAFGGLTTYRPTHRDPRKQILITLAGPGAGFVLAALVCVAMGLAGHPISFARAEEFPWFAYTVAGGDELPGNLRLLIGMTLFVNIVWGLFNLLPVYPLDGGRLVFEGLSLARVPSALEITFQITIAVAIAVAAFAVMRQQVFTAIFFGYMAYASFLSLRAGRWS